jgi:hypothetical protein
MTTVYYPTNGHIFFTPEIEEVPPDPAYRVLAKALRIYGIRTSYSDNALGIVKPAKHKKVDMISFTLREDGKLFCVRTQLAYDLNKPRSFKWLVRSLKFCSESRHCKKPCLFGE